MSEIPADIMATARKIEEEFWSQNVPQGSEITVAGFIALAILAERKRCASAYMHWARKMMEEVEKE